MLGPDLPEQDRTVPAGIPQTGVGLEPGLFVVGIIPGVQLPDHDEIALVDDRGVLQHPLGVGLLCVAGFAAGIVAGGGDYIQQGLDPLAKGVGTDLVDLGIGMGVVFIHHKVAGRTGVLVLGVLGKGPHIAAPGPVDNGIGPWDQQPLCNGGALPADLLGVAQHAHGLATVHCCALHFRLLLKHRFFRSVGRVASVRAHMVQALAGFLRALVVAPGPLVVGFAEAPGPGVLVDPAVSTAQVEHLPGLQGDGLPCVHAPDLDALAEPPNNPVGPGGVKHIGEVLRPLALQVVQVPLTGQDLVLAALLPKSALSHLLGVDRHRVVQAALPPIRQRDHRPDPPWHRLPPGPASGPAAPDRRA